MQWFEPEPAVVRGLPLATWLARRGHRVEVVTGFPNYPGGRLYPGYRMAPIRREWIGAVLVTRVALYPSHDRSPVRRVGNYASFALTAATIGMLSAKPSDVVYVYHPPATLGIPALAWRRFRRTPFVYHIADMWPESVTESGMIRSDRARNAVDRSLSWWCDRVYRSASAISVLSPGFKRLLLERGVAPEKVEVIYNWADEHVFRPGPPDEGLARELGFSGRFTVLYAGNLGLFQGLDTAVRAAARVRHLEGFQLVLMGTGQAADDLSRLATALGATNVVFLGRRDEKEMGAVNNVADVLLISLKDLAFFRTTVPGKTQVSLASGKPVIISAAGDAADLIEQAHAGIVCPPGDDAALAAAFARMYAAPPTELRTFGSNARRFYEHHLSLDTGAARTEALLERVAAGVGRRARLAEGAA